MLCKTDHSPRPLGSGFSLEVVQGSITRQKRHGKQGESKYGYDSGRNLCDLASNRRALAARQSLVSLVDKVATSLFWTIFHPAPRSFLGLSDPRLWAEMKMMMSYDCTMAWEGSGNIWIGLSMSL